MQPGCRQTPARKDDGEREQAGADAARLCPELHHRIVGVVGDLQLPGEGAFANRVLHGAQRAQALAGDRLLLDEIEGVVPDGEAVADSVVCRRICRALRHIAKYPGGGDNEESDPGGNNPEADAREKAHDRHAREGGQRRKDAGIDATEIADRSRDREDHGRDGSPAAHHAAMGEVNRKHRGCSHHDDGVARDVLDALPRLRHEAGGRSSACFS